MSQKRSLKEFLRFPQEIPACTRCRRRFGVQEFYPLDGLLPLSLPCGHLVCQACANSNKEDRCPFGCAAASEEDQKAALLVHLHTLGLIIAKLNCPTDHEDVDSAFYLPLSTKLLEEYREGHCSECGLVASWKCIQCAMLFCDVCYNKIHGRALQKHSRVPAGGTGTSVLFLRNLCSVECMEKLSQFCKSCSVEICSECAIRDHVGHEILELKKFNEEHRAEFEEAIRTTSETLQRVRQSQKKISGCPEKSGSVEATINVHFLRLHGILQRIETRIVGRLRDQEEAVLANARNITTRLTQMEEQLGAGLLLTAIANQNIERVNVSEVIGRLKELSSLPCHVLQDPSLEEKLIKFEVDDKIVGLLEEHCHVELHETEALLQLVPTESLPEGYPLEPLPELTARVPTLPQAEQLFEPVAPDLRRRATKSLVEGSVDLVNVVYIEDPFCFYVQLSPYIAKLRELEEQIQKVADQRPISEDEVVLNKLYIVKYQKTQKWHRCRVIGQEKDQCTVFYIDYGMKETLPFTALRQAHPRFTYLPSMALQCSLVHITPKNGKWSAEAKDYFRLLLSEEIVVIWMHTLTICGETYMVDLCLVPSRGLQLSSLRESMVLAGFATFVSTSKLLRTNPFSTKTFTVEQLLTDEYTYVRVSHVESPEEIYVQKAEDTAEYLRKLEADMTNYFCRNSHTGEVIHGISEGLPCAAENSEGIWQRCLALNVHGKDSITVFIADHGRRVSLPCAKVRPLPRRFMGAKTQAIRVSLRYLEPLSEKDGWTEETTSFIRGCLKSADVIRLFAFERRENSYSCSIYHGDKDDNLARLIGKEGLAKYVGPMCYMDEPQEQRQKRKSLKCQGGSKKELTIKRVQNSLTSSRCSESDLNSSRKLTGVSSNTYLNTNSNTDPPTRSKPETGVDLNANPRTSINTDSDSELNSSLSQPTRLGTASEPCLNSKSDTRLYVKLHTGRGRKIKILKNPARKQSAKANTVQKPRSAAQKPEDPFKIRVLVHQVKSPDRIYVADASCEAPNSEFQEQMQEFYRRFHASEERSWDDDSVCVARAKDSQFYRARILERKGSEDFLVLLIDKGREEVVSRKDLQPLHPRFARVPSHVFAIKLAGILPCGGSGTWPSLSCEELRGIVETNMNCKFFISKIEEDPVSESVISVELWVKQSKVDGPLDPTRIEINSVNRMLVEKGVALPMKNYAQKRDKILAVELKRQLKKRYRTLLEYERSIKWTTNDSDVDAASLSEFDVGLDDSESGSNSDADTDSAAFTSGERIKDWLPPEPIPEERFIGIPTYLDYEAVVHLHSRKRNAKNLKWMDKLLQEVYNGQSIRACDVLWEKGDLCIAQYHADNKWYRGRVVEVLRRDLMRVEFVDYGNVEECSVGMLRKDLILTDVPVQCTKCIVFNLVPCNGSWATSDLDLIHSLLVDRECHVTVLGEINTCQVVSITLTDGNKTAVDLLTFLRNDLQMNFVSPWKRIEDMTNIAPKADVRENEREINCDVEEETRVTDFEVETEPNETDTEADTRDMEISIGESERRTMDEMSEESADVIVAGFIDPEEGGPVAGHKPTWEKGDNIEDEVQEALKDIEDVSWNHSNDVAEDDEPTNASYSIMVMPNDVDFIEIKLSCNVTATTFLAHVLENIHSEELSDNYERYERLMKDIQVNADKQSPLRKFTPGTPCCAKFTDGVWYRCLLKERKDNGSKGIEFTLVYVDFGNSETRTINAEEDCNLYCLKEEWLDLPMMSVQCQLYDLEVVENANQDVLLEQLESLYERPLIARIKDRTSSLLRVELFESPEAKKSVHDRLIKSGVFYIKKSKQKSE